MSVPPPRPSSQAGPYRAGGTAWTPLPARPIGRHNREGAGEVTDLRFIVLHMIEETARHAGHLDIARELIDGRTGLGPR